MGALYTSSPQASDGTRISENEMGPVAEPLMRPVTGKSAWRAHDFETVAGYTRSLVQEEIDEIHRAIADVQSRQQGAEELRGPEDFPLPRLSSTLRKLQTELEDGRGFALLRGLPVNSYDLEGQRALAMGILLHLGQPVVQDTKGTLVESVTDRGLSYKDRRVRGYMTHAELTPHCDSGDVVGLVCVRSARKGGVSQICSGASIYNELLNANPELIPPLYRGFHHNIRGNGPVGPWEDLTRHLVPVFSYYEGRLSIRYNLKALLTAQELPGVNPLSELERRAIERVAELAMSDDLRLEMSLQPGDLQLLNNYTILHSRTEFEDDPESSAKRLLLRVWINMPNSRPLEDRFADHFNTGPRQPPAQKG